MKDRPAVAVVHPQLVEGGGSEGCALWMLDALQDEYRLTLVTMGHLDLDLLNRAYGTQIDPAKIACRFLPVPAGMSRRFAALRGFRLARYCRRHAREFDALVSAYNVMDFGRAGIQRISDFSFDDSVRRALFPKKDAGTKIFYQDSLWRSAYLWLGRALSGTSEAGWKKNLTMANSNWTRDILKQRFGIDSVVVYPPVHGGVVDVPWEEREDGFVVMGRLVPEKGIESIISILENVRRVKDVHLHIFGRSDDPAYAARLEALAAERSPWVRLEGSIFGPEKMAFLARHKYGISGCRHEAFGVAVAEMVKAGCVVWVPDGGGQVEIVDHPELIYPDDAQAAARIIAVLGDPWKEAALRSHLAGRSEAFSTEKFVREVRAIVHGFIESLRGAHA